MCQTSENVISMQEEYGITTLTFQDEFFPHSLRKIGYDCPRMIHCLGDMSLVDPKANRIAIMGGRAASPTGLRKAYELGKQFAEEDVSFCSQKKNGWSHLAMAQPYLFFPYFDFTLMNIYMNTRIK